MKKTLLSYCFVGLAAATLLTNAARAENIYAEQDTQKFLNVLNTSGGKPLETLSPTDARKVLEGAQANVKSQPAVDISYKTIKVDQQSINLVIVRPAGVKKTLPAFMFFHGGGWVLGDFPTHERFVRDLVAESGFPAVFVDYTRSPEAKFPTAINQAYAATKWVSEHGKEINIDGSRLAVAGNSVGGNMATVVSLMAKEKGTPHIRFQMLFWPVTKASFDNASYSQFEQGYFLTKNMMKWFWDNYTTDQKERNSIYASPLNASVEQLKGLPPTLIQTAELDVLRDEAEEYGNKLDQAWVDVSVVRYKGMIHDFGLLNPLSNLTTTRTALKQAAYEIKKHLQD
jgi:acetyl esterase/lipase